MPIISGFSLSFTVRRAIALIFLGSLMQAVALATTVIEVDVDYLLDTAELVFEGEVVQSEAAWNAERSAIFTIIRFRVTDVIKGEHAAEFITLKYAGGIVGGHGMRVSSMVYPQLGERGIYFIESKTQQLINPMVGWGQGHFVLARDNAGVDRVLTEGRKKVLSLESAADLAQSAATRNAAGNTTSRPSEFSHGVARGVITDNITGGANAGMNKGQFKRALRERLGITQGEVRR